MLGTPRRCRAHGLLRVVLPNMFGLLAGTAHADGTGTLASLKIAADTTPANSQRPTSPTANSQRCQELRLWWYRQSIIVRWVWQSSGGNPWTMQACIAICTYTDSNAAHRASLATALFKILSCARPQKFPTWVAEIPTHGSTLTRLDAPCSHCLVQCVPTGVHCVMTGHLHVEGVWLNHNNRGQSRSPLAAAHMSGTLKADHCCLRIVLGMSPSPSTLPVLSTRFRNI